MDEAATMLLAAGVADTITLDDRHVQPRAPARARAVGRRGGGLAGGPRSLVGVAGLIAELASDAAMTSDDGGRPEVSFTWALEAPVGDGRGPGG